MYREWFRLVGFTGYNMPITAMVVRLNEYNDYLYYINRVSDMLYLNPSNIQIYETHPLSTKLTHFYRYEPMNDESIHLIALCIGNNFIRTYLPPNTIL